MNHIEEIQIDHHPCMQACSAKQSGSRGSGAFLARFPYTEMMNDKRISTLNKLIY
jgi:hypothetical protein